MTDGGGTRAIADDCRSDARQAIAAGDWSRTYAAAKLWVARGGGAWAPEAWLLYAASAVLLGQPRTGVRSMDLALGNWVEAQPDRSVLHWARACLVAQHLRDPKTALADYESARAGCPPWLRATLKADLDECAAAAEKSRKKKPSVSPAPAYEPRHGHDTVSPADPMHSPGTQPPLWSPLIAVLRPATASG